MGRVFTLQKGVVSLGELALLMSGALSLAPSWGQRLSGVECADKARVFKSGDWSPHSIIIRT